MALYSVAAAARQTCRKRSCGMHFVAFFRNRLQPANHFLLSLTALTVGVYFRHSFAFVVPCYWRWLHAAASIRSVGPPQGGHLPAKGNTYAPFEGAAYRPV